MSSFTSLHLFHIFIIGSLLIYLGIKQKQTPAWVFHILTFLGIFIVIYHSYRAYLAITEKKALPWINAFHIFVIAPLLISLGLLGTNSPRYLFEFMLMLGFSVIGYHAYYLLIGQ
jgi:hypothetical protein